MGTLAHKKEVYGNRIEKGAVREARLGASSSVLVLLSTKGLERDNGNFLPSVGFYPWEANPRILAGSFLCP
jgi:hypothetical protein